VSTTTKKFLRRSAAVSAVAGIVVLTATGPAFAADGDVDVVNTETVQVYMDADGKVDTKRVYEQLALSGNGKVDLTNPIATSGLRNLDGFGGYDVKDGEQLVNTQVDGEKKLRSVSDYTRELPLDISVSYELDGKSVEPGDVVGKSGKLAVDFTVENVTAQSQEVTVPDGKGGTTTKTLDVAIPMVGSLSTVAPSNFTHVASKQANMAGDGKGGTKMSFTMTLFEPIGSTTARFGYTADITEGVVPKVEVSALPVNPLESPTFASAATSYQGGADTGAKLTDGATQIDANLLKLRDGSAELLAGLIKLRDGAGELSAGLNDKAAPGADKLAAGAGELSSGLTKLDDGAGRLSDGSNRLAAGTGDAAAGGKKLTDGLKQISGGLGKLADQLPGASEGIVKLQGGIDQLSAGLGSPSDDTTLIGGLVKLSNGLGLLNAGAGQVNGGLQQLTGAEGLPKAKGGVDQVRAGLQDSLGSLNTLETTMNQLKAVCADNATCVAIANGVLGTVDGSRTKTNQAIGGLDQVSAGLGNAIGAINTQLIPGTGQIAGGLTDAKAAVDGKLVPGAQKLKGGLGEVRAGLDQLAEGLTAALTGINKLNAGAGTAYAGSGDLADGLGRLDAGANELSDGAGQLADGAGAASDGGTKVADGAGQLSDGLGDAADGSDLIFGGLTKAAGSAPKLPEGAERLSEEGTKKLVAAGQATAQDYGEKVAVIKAGAERAQAEDMAFGAPSDAVGLTAYSYILQGEDGEGRRNVARAAGGLAMLGAAGGVMFMRRRWLS
jgi:putative membrane protein